MSAYAGSSLIVKWMVGSGTSVLSGDQRNFSYTPSVALIDQTAGADANKLYLSSIKDGQASLEAVMQAGTDAGGTTVFSTCTEGQIGTLEWQPEGTAVGTPKISMAAISQGASFQYPYSDVISVTVNWQQNGARTEGTN